MGKNLHANAGDARNVGSIPPLEKEMATHSSTLPWKIPWTEEVWWTVVHGVTKSGTWLRTHAQLIDKISDHVLLIWTYSFRHLCVGVCPCSMVSDSEILWTEAHKASLSMGFPRQEYWSGLPFPPPGDLSAPGTKPTSPALAVGFFITWATWEAHIRFVHTYIYIYIFFFQANFLYWLELNWFQSVEKLSLKKKRSVLGVHWKD